MKKVMPILILLAGINISINAKIITVDNAGRIANYTSLSTAVTAATVGDTILIGGSPANYDNITLQKRLCFIGPGYFLTENPNTIEYKVPAKITTVTFSPGSEGSVIMGMTIANITVSTSNITIKRCNLNGSIYINGNGNTIKQNYFTIHYSGTTTYFFQINGRDNIIRNNYFANTASWSYPVFNCGTTNMVENNIFNGSIAINSSLFGNNIIYAGNTSFTNSSIYNNISGSDQVGTENGNQSNVSMSAVFYLTGSSDGKYILAPGSPAIGAGYEGVDCGIFGGNDPYVLSGIPDIPVITSLTVPVRTSPTNGLEVIMNVRSNK
ncbi:MAG: hypothetical protein JXN62_12840 [Bacteroidales bacterium]|nr:hypothetical protein [Bacteroidales bacterium]